MQFAEAFRRNALRQPHAVAVRSIRGDLTYATLDARSDWVCAALFHDGVSPGDRVAVQTPNRAEYVEVLLGIAKAGAVLVPVSYLDGPQQLAHVLNDSGARLLVFDPSVAETVAVVSEYVP